MDDRADPSSSGHSPSSTTTTPPPQPPPPPPQPPPPPPPACAACKHQRRKCKPDCKLSPYFPADQPARFRNAHRLFGIKNIIRLMDTAGEGMRDDAMKSVVYESDAWAADPVRGAAGVVTSLTQELCHVKAELAAVNQLLELYRRAEARQQQRPAPVVVVDGSFNPQPSQAPLPFLPAPPILQQDGDYDVYAAPPYAGQTTVEDYLVEPPTSAVDAVTTSAAERHEDGRAPATAAASSADVKGERYPTSSMMFR